MAGYIWGTVSRRPVLMTNYETSSGETRIGEVIKDMCKRRKSDFTPEAVGSYIFITMY